MLLLLNLAVMGWIGVEWLQRYQDRFLERAEQALIENNEAEAIRALDAHLRRYPDDSAAAHRVEVLREDYRQRYLEEAEAHLQVGDKVSAIRAYRNHIQAYPDDYDTRLKLAELYEELDINEASEALYRDILSEKEGSGDRLESVARQRLFRHVNEWANGIKIEADRLFEEGEFETAAAEYTRVINLRSRNPALEAGKATRMQAIAAINDVIAKRAFSLWRSGEADALGELDSEYDNGVFPDGPVPGGVMRQRKAMLSNYFWDYADRLFEREDWGRAAEMYRVTLDMRNAGSGNEPDPNTPTLLFNYALSQYRDGNHDEALKALQRIQSEFPYHEKAAVSQLSQELEESMQSGE